MSATTSAAPLAPAGAGRISCAAADDSSTPVTTRQRRRRPSCTSTPNANRRRGAGGGEAITPPVMITPTTDLPGIPRRFHDEMDACREDDDDEDEEEEEEEYDLPASQYPAKPNTSGGVYWNYEASPETKARLQRRLAEADAKSPSAGKKPEPFKRKKKFVPAPRRRLAGDQPPTEKQQQQQKAALNSMQEFLINIEKERQEQLEQATATATAKADQNDQSSGRKQKDDSGQKSKNGTEDKDLFGDSEDDSFLLKCSQAVEAQQQQQQQTTHSPLKPPPPVPGKKATLVPHQPSGGSNKPHLSDTTNRMKPIFRPLVKQGALPPPKPKGPSNVPAATNVFDDDGDDSFDMLLSQLDEPGLGGKATTTLQAPSSSVTSKPHRPTVVQPGSAATANAPSALLPALRSSSSQDASFKRFRSAGDPPGGGVASKPASSPSTTCKPTSSTVTNWSRVNSSPSVPPSAIDSPTLPGGRSRVSQQSYRPICTQAEIEKKRLEAMKKREQRKKMMARK